MDTDRSMIDAVWMTGERRQETSTFIIHGVTDDQRIGAAIRGNFPNKNMGL